jgi:hypothetical protein
MMRRPIRTAATSALLILAGLAGCTDDAPKEDGVERLTLEAAVERANGALDATVAATGLPKAGAGTDSGNLPCTNPFEDGSGKTRSVSVRLALAGKQPTEVLLTIAETWRDRGFSVKHSDNMIRDDPDPRVDAESEDGKVEWNASVHGPAVGVTFSTVCLPSRAG